MSSATSLQYPVEKVTLIPDSGHHSAPRPKPAGLPAESVAAFAAFSRLLSHRNRGRFPSGIPAGSTGFVNRAACYGGLAVVIISSSPMEELNTSVERSWTRYAPQA
jgi:hypothetical protein